MCYDSSDQVQGAGVEASLKHYETTINYSRPIKKESFKYKWDGDGKIELTGLKINGASYWPDLVKEKTHMWRTMHNKYVEMVEDYRKDDL